MHWLEEAAALAQAAGVDPDDYVAYQGAKYRGINTPECFTYFSAPRYNADAVTLFHKNRDNRDRPQSAYVKGVEVPGRTTFRFIATGDTSDMGAMMGLNEKGLAAAADTGSPDPNPRYRGMMNPDLMRLILEQAADVAQAHDMLEQFHAERIYAGGKVATNWMFADSSGRGMRICQFHDTLQKTHDEESLMVMREDERGNLVLSTFDHARGSISPHLLNRLSRTAPVLHKTNISAMTAVIPSSKVDLFGYAQFAVFSAGRTVYVPLYLGAGATPRVLADGTLYRLSTTQPGEFGRVAGNFEAELEVERTLVKAAARSELENSGTDAARRILTEGCLSFAQRAREYLSQVVPIHS